MGRQAADLFERNRYARRVAACRAAEMLRDDAIGVAGVRELRVEAVDRRIFDDLVETWVDGSRHGWQIKSQTTPLPRDQLREIFDALRDQPDLAAGHLALDAHLSIQDLGELRQLTIPPELGPAADVLTALRERVQAVEAEREAERQRTGGRVYGRRAVLAQSWRGQPTSRSLGESATPRGGPEQVGADRGAAAQPRIRRGVHDGPRSVA